MVRVPSRPQFIVRPVFKHQQSVVGTRQSLQDLIELALSSHISAVSPSASTRTS